MSQDDVRVRSEPREPRDLRKLARALLQLAAEELDAESQDADADEDES